VKLKRTRIILATVALVALVLVHGIVERLRQPVYEGKRVGEWFDDLCSNPFNSSGQLDPNKARVRTAAVEAFSRMDSNVVPYLVRELTQRATYREKFILKGRDMPILNPLFKHIYVPSHLRRTAAFALRQMGTNAEASAPVLLLEYRKSKHPTYAIALSFVLGMPYRPTNSELALNDLEESVMKVAKARYPDLFPPQLVPLDTNALPATNSPRGP
jgi:hypothetical protein